MTSFWEIQSFSNPISLYVILYCCGWFSTGKNLIMINLKCKFSLNLSSQCFTEPLGFIDWCLTRFPVFSHSLSIYLLPFSFGNHKYALNLLGLSHSFQKRWPVFPSFYVAFYSHNYGFFFVSFFLSFQPVMFLSGSGCCVCMGFIP